MVGINWDVWTRFDRTAFMSRRTNTLEDGLRDAITICLISPRMKRTRAACGSRLKVSILFFSEREEAGGNSNQARQKRYFAKKYPALVQFCREGCQGLKAMLTKTTNKFQYGEKGLHSKGVMIDKNVAAVQKTFTDKKNFRLIRRPIGLVHLVPTPRCL